MNRLFYLFVLLPLFGLMWSCSEESPTPADILVPDEQLSPDTESEQWISLEKKNTELIAHIPGPCCGNPLIRVPTRESIHFHRGIKGIGDLDPEIYGWKKVVAKMIIKRLNKKEQKYL